MNKRLMLGYVCYFAPLVTLALVAVSVLLILGGWTAVLSGIGGGLLMAGFFGITNYGINIIVREKSKDNIPFI